MLILVLSDLHLGKGKFLRNGQINILEDFDEDDRIVEFFDYYASEKFEDIGVKIVLNGDILNLIQIDVDGVFTHLQTEDFVVRSLESIYRGHKKFFEGLKRFLAQEKNKLVYVIGNHDIGMSWPGAQAKFNEFVGGETHFAHQYQFAGVHIEHGHRFELINNVPERHIFVEGPNGHKVLNLPWGSLFCVYLMPLLKKERPHIDKVRPLSLYLRWSLFHDTWFIARNALKLFKYFRKTTHRSFTRYNKNFKMRFRVLRSITIFPRYARKAKKILKLGHNRIHTVIMGHTHIAEWRKFPEGKYYFNTGTWNSVSSVDAGLHDSIKKLTYVSIEVDENSNSLMNAYMNIWQGRWRPYVEEVSLTRGKHSR